MRVLGVDPGSRFMGYGVVEEKRGGLLHVAHGVLRAQSDQALEIRLSALFAQLCQALAAYRPDAVAVEGVFTLRNARSALVLGHARGIALLAAAQTGLVVHEYSPAKVKRAVGAGGADGKEAVSQMVRTFLHLPAFERTDASDALAVAICHLNFARVGQASARARSADPRTGKGFAPLAARLSPAYKRFGAGG